jgi:hypothetical protein
MMNAKTLQFVLFPFGTQLPVPNSLGYTGPECAVQAEEQKPIDEFNTKLLGCHRDSQFKSEPAADCAAAYRRGGWVLIRSPDLSNPTAKPGSGVFVLFCQIEAPLPQLKDPK